MDSFVGVVRYIFQSFGGKYGSVSFNHIVV